MINQRTSDPVATIDNPATRLPDVAASPTPSNSVGGPLALQPGGRPLPDFELLRKLGAGGFGEVWHARGPGGIEVAMKFVRLGVGGSELEVRSLELMRAVRHPNLVSLFGAWHQPQHGMLILAMELCDSSLHNRLEEVRASNLPGIPAEEMLEYLRDAAWGLDSLNDKNIQHRDIKPPNLLLMHNRVKVGDFGLAKAMERSVATNTGAMTPHYAAPECFKGEIARQSDQYSLAVTYYQLRTGMLPFAGSIERVMFGHLHGEPDLTRLPPAERGAVGKALAKEPGQRYSTCQAFARALAESHVSPQPLQETPPLAQAADQDTVFPRDQKTKQPDQKTKQPPKTLAVELGGGATMEFVLIRPGKFWMGSPKDEKRRNPWEKDFDAEELHEVEITRAFYLAVYPTTQEQYKSLTGKTPSYFCATGAGKDKVEDLDTGRFPVETVSWHEARAFCALLTKMDTKGRRFTLPTEAEWEFACRAGTKTAFHFGEVLDGDKAICEGNYPYGTDFKGDRHERTCAVGLCPPNGWGLRDMHGHVWQLCEDVYGPCQDLGSKDPLRANVYATEARVLRGGSWLHSARHCRAANRCWIAPGSRGSDVGFRVCLRLH